MKSKTLLYLVLLIVSYNYSKSQVNLVPNGDFEVYSSCPTGTSQISKATHWSNAGGVWLDPTSVGYWPLLTSPDYFNGCALTSSKVSVINNGQGIKFDHTNNAGFQGVGYAGIIGLARGRFAYRGETVYDDKWTEYIKCTISPMRVGNLYRAEYYAALSDSSYFAHSLGLCISNGTLSSTSTYLNPPTGSVFFQFPLHVITHDMDWKKVEYLFVCNDASLNTLTIGNFLDTSYSRVTVVRTENYSRGIGASCHSYYYIDDVSLVCVDSMPRNNMPASYSLCNGYPRLDAGGGSLGSIQWYYNDTLLVGATGRYYYPTRPGIYKFIVSSSIVPGYTYTDETIIYDSPLNTQISYVPNTDCDTFLYMAIRNPQSNLVYSWTATNVASGYPSSATDDEFSTKFDHTAPLHIITLHVTDLQSSCVFDTSFTIYPCCRKINGPPVYINERINDLIWYDLAFSNPYFGSAGPGCQFCNTISIDGVLSIEKNYRFKNTAFYMQAYSRIDITAGDTLFLDSCYLTACSDIMWKGIFNGTLEWGNGTLIATHCIIEDAICGITILNGSYTHCIADTFNKNQTDIRVKPFYGTYNPLQVTKSVFICKDLGWRSFLGFPDPGDYLGLLIHPYWGLKPHECILAENVNNLQIGSGCLNCTNYFNDAYTGIHTINTNLTAYNNHFTNMQPYGKYIGAGIFAEKPKNASGYLRYNTTVGGYLVNLQNTFIQNRYGIISRNIESTIQNNTFNYCVSAILVDSGNTHPGTSPMNTIIKDNFIYNYMRGVEASSNKRTTISILRNQLETVIPNFSNPSSIGIFANQTIYPSTFEIKDNTIKNGRTAISLLNINNSRIIGNQIKMSSANTFAIIGINSNNSTRNVYAFNRVVGSTTEGASSMTLLGSSKAMYFGMSPNDTIHCNITDTMTWGLEFMGSCISVNNIFGNIMNKHHDQMTLRSAGVIGPQTSRNFGILTNRLMANEFSPTLYTRSNTCAINSDGLISTYHSKSVTPYRPLVNIAIGTGARPINPIPTVKSNYLCNPYISSGSPGTGLEFDSSGIDEEKWMAEAIIAGDIVSEIENEAYQLWLKSELYAALMNDSAIAASDSLYQAFLSTNALGSIGMFYDIEQKIINEEYADALALLASIEPNTHYEENEKTIYTILLQEDSGMYNQEVLNQLYIMAEECPISGGKAVYISRAILSTLDIEAHWEDDDRCIAGIDFRKANPVSTIADSEIVIYPNPAHNILNLSSNTMNIYDTYIIKDMLGRCVLYADIDKENSLNQIDISKLAEGTYIIEIINAKNNKEQYKFNVFK